MDIGDQCDVRQNCSTVLNETDSHELLFVVWVQIMNILMSRFPYGSEMSGSGAAHDPLFWVAHG
jgi:hypothetical protein